MRRAMSLLAACVLATVGVGAYASPASAALPACYRLAPLDTGHVGPINVPSAGSTPSSTSCIMRNGHRSDAVVRLKENLNVCFDGADIPMTRLFDDTTEAALKRTQRALGITADGVYGPVTRDTMPWWAGGGGCWRVNGPGGA